MDPVPDNTPAAPRPARTGRTLIAWLVIAATVLVIAGIHLVPPTAALQEQAQETEQRLNLVGVEMLMRYLVGLNQIRERYPVLAGVAGMSAAELCEQARQYAGSDAGQRLCLVTVVGELSGPGAALRELDRLGAGAGPGVQQQLRDILRRVYQDQVVGRYDLPSVRPGQRLFLADEFGWFGALALHPEGPKRDPDVFARVVGPAALAIEPDRFVAPDRATVLGLAERTCIVIWIATVFFFGALCAGFLGLGGVAIWAGQKGWRSGLDCGSTSHGGVYAETFALWLILYFGLSLVATQVLEQIPAMARAGLAMLLSLLALGWPVARGIRWAQVRADIGWSAGRRWPAIEAALGVAGYVSNLPVVLLGMFATLGLVWLRNHLSAGGAGAGPGDEGPMPGHPLFQFVATADWPNLLLLLLLANAIAPVVEETFFRGVLYRHLRELTWNLGRWRSVLISTLGVSFLFAVIHPQGLTAVPVLMALACGFCLLREWRGTLIASICAHALNNTLVTLFILGALGR